MSFSSHCVTCRALLQKQFIQRLVLLISNLIVWQVIKLRETHRIQRPFSSSSNSDICLTRININTLSFLNILIPKKQSSILSITQNAVCQTILNITKSQNKSEPDNNELISMTNADKHDSPALKPNKIQLKLSSCLEDQHSPL